MTAKTMKSPTCGQDNSGPFQSLYNGEWSAEVDRMAGELDGEELLELA